jgi:thymidylate synthase
MIWVGDAFKKYMNSLNDEVGNWCHPECDVLTKPEFIEKIKTDSSFANRWGELGPVYGKQWVDWGGYEIVSGKEVKGLNKGVNQIQVAIDMLKNNPNSRRIMVSAWNVSDLDKMTLPPCHYGFLLNTVELTLKERGDYWFWNHKPNRYVVDDWDELSDSKKHEYLDDSGVPRHKVSLMWNQRSVDTFLGLPFNIASYGMLLHMIAQQVNMIPNELIGSLGDTHIYTNHIEQVNTQLTREPMALPQLVLNKADDIKKMVIALVSKKN